MKALFLFHDRWYQYVEADWAASRFPFDGFVVIERERPWWGRYLWKRARRIGFRKVADEIALRLYWLLFHSRADRKETEKLMNRLAAELPPDYERPPVYRLDNINSDESVELLQRLAPDVCVLMVHPMINKRVFTIPRHGMLVFHPGVTPEYRGPHSAFWATMNHDFEGIGWSILRINEGIDTGQVLAQGTTEDVQPLEESHIVMQHKAHIDGLPAVVDVLRQLEDGHQPNVSMEGRKSSNYTHPGLSDYMKLRKRVNGWRRESARGESAEDFVSDE